MRPSPLPEDLGQIAGALALLGFVSYVVAILRRQTRPSRATWWIWTIVGVVLCASYLSSGATVTIWVPISYALGPLVAAMLSLHYGEGGWTRFDRACFLGTGASLALWAVVRSPIIPLTMNIVIDLLGALPTLRKTFDDPDSEDRLAWLLFFVANTLNLLAISRWSFSIVLYPLYLFALNGVMVALLVRPRAVVAPDQT